MALVSPYLLIITLNVNELNFPVKRCGMAGCGVLMEEPTIYCLQESNLSIKDSHSLKVKEWEMILHASGSQKRAGVAILTSYKINWAKMIIRNRDGHYIMLKGSTQQEDIAIINIYAPNIIIPKYFEKVLTGMKGEIDKNTVIIGNHSTPLSTMEWSYRRKSARKLWIEPNFRPNGTNRDVQCSIQQQQNTHSSQAHLEYSPE